MSFFYNINFQKSFNEKHILKLSTYRKDLLKIYFYFFKIVTNKKAYKIIKLPNKKKKFTIIKSPHIFKKAKEHYGYNIFNYIILFNHYFNFKKHSRLPSGFIGKLLHQYDYCVKY